MKRTVRVFPVLVIFLVGLLPLVQAGSSDIPDWDSKVDPLVLETLAEGETEFLVILDEQADLSPADHLKTKEAKGAFVYSTLTALARRTQGPLLADLETLGATYRPFWIVNMVWVRGGAEVVQAVAARNEVARLEANPHVRLQEVQLDFGQAARSPDTIEWNIALVGAPAVWAAGYTGQNIVIGGQDTGYYWEHTGLKNQYRGWEGALADHDYNWHDAIHTGGGSCGADSPFPCDDYGHGTHTMGTMVGNDLDPADPGWPAAAPNAVGMAPGAEWIGCRNMDQGVGTPATYTECYEFFIAPYPVGGDPMTDGDPTKAPHVINNSWSCPPSEGCSAGTLLSVVQSVTAAGIVTAHSAGNDGSSCGTVSDPAATYDESFSVGATTNTDAIALFSSRGPSSYDGGLKPDISAPGVNINSTLRSGGYGTNQGTSMAAPHVAGLVALLLSAQPTLAGDVDLIESLITGSAVPLTTTQDCGTIPGSQVPNHTFGWGRIDAAAALESLDHDLALSKEAPETIFAGEVLTYTLHVTHTHPITLTQNVVLTDTLPVGTTYLTATLPHSFDGNQVRWDFPGLNAGETVSVALAVQTSPLLTGTVTNADYQVASDDVAPVPGSPVLTTILTPKVWLTPDHLGFGNPGTVISYTHTISNFTTTTETYSLTLSGTSGWTSLPVTALTLAPGEAHTFTVTAAIPLSATMGMLDQAVITATGQTDPDLTASVTDTTIVPYLVYMPYVSKE